MKLIKLNLKYLATGSILILLFAGGYAVYSKIFTSALEDNKILGNYDKIYVNSDLGVSFVQPNNWIILDTSRNEDETQVSFTPPLNNFDNNLNSNRIVLTIKDFTRMEQTSADYISEILSGKNHNDGQFTNHLFRKIDGINAVSYDVPNNYDSLVSKVTIFVLDGKVYSIGMSFDGDDIKYPDYMIVYQDIVNSFNFINKNNL
ncbi:MAG: hypothetical protein V4668_04035 [Patescibacteria group bacterium]